ncbi:MAG: C_GCAxxG_C_C family protein [Nitrospirae bacterium]|nr:C_GCAxxG_C_C family protein [Nitrospirota bacterium]
MNSDEKKLSRRGIIVGAGKLALGAAGIALVSSGGQNLVSIAEAKETPLPWPYEKIDPEETAKIAYDGWYKAYCSYAVASGILTPLQNKIGGPYSMLPVDGLRLGEGGIVGWGTICGTLLGATVATGFIAPYDVGKQVVNEVMQWYSDTQLPVFTPEKPKAEVRLKSVSNSPLCHISVNKWCQAAGKSFGSPERRDRCARLAADIAAHTVMLLNDWKDGKFVSTLKMPPALYGTTGQHNCNECHTKIPDVIG